MFQKCKQLTALGSKVLRFTDEEVLKNMNDVIERIERVVEEMEMSSPPPALPPVRTEVVVKFPEKPQSFESSWLTCGFN